jgi:predicted AAA+ superfamily ATPase
LQSGVPGNRILRVQFDELPEIHQESEPILRLADWFERAILRETLNEAARAGRPAYLFLDEAQNLEGWAPQLKSLVDHASVRVVVTGSSALRIELGRDSLARRFSSLEASVLSLTEIARFHNLPALEPFLADNGLERCLDIEFWHDLVEHGRRNEKVVQRAFQWFSERGGYPLVHQREDIPWSHLADQLNETVIKRVILHDLRVGERGRKRDENLLEEIFRLACRYAGQSPAAWQLAREVQDALDANVGPRRVVHYLQFLAATLLVRLIRPLEIRLKRQRGSPTICIADHGLRASWLQEVIPLAPEALARAPELATLAGHLAESVVGTTLSTINGLDLAHQPQRQNEPEVDFVLTVGTRRIPLEVKYQRRIDELRDTLNLRQFLEKAANNAPFGILVTQLLVAVNDPRIVALPLSSLLLLR